MKDLSDINHMDKTFNCSNIGQIRNTMPLKNIREVKKNAY